MAIFKLKSGSGFLSIDGYYNLFLLFLFSCVKIEQKIMWQIKQNLAVFLSTSGFSGQSLLLLACLVFVWVIASLFWLKNTGLFLLCYLEKKFDNQKFSVWLNLFEKFNVSIILLNGLFFASMVVNLPRKISNLIDCIYVLVSVFFVINLIREAIGDAIKVYLRARGNISEEAIKTVINFANVTSLMVLWAMAILVFLQVSQVDTQALLGGLGVASIIVAFSFQNLLRDIFAFFAIYVDRSFGVGDYIVFDKFEGVIKEIRLRTTKIQALKGHDIIVSNFQLTNGVIENYNRLKQRRIAIEFRIDNNLTNQKIEKLLVDLKEIFVEPALAEKIELSSVVLDQITDMGLLFKIIYRFNGADYLEHLNFKEKINLKVMQSLTDNQIKLVQLPMITNLK